MHTEPKRRIIECPSGLKVRIKTMTVRDERTIQCRDLPSEKTIRLVRNMCELVEPGPYQDNILENPENMLSEDARTILMVILSQTPDKEMDRCPECGAPLGGKLIRF